MPAKSKLLTCRGPIEVAPHLSLSLCLADGLMRFGPLSSFEAASWAYWGRNPRKTRLGLRWQANPTQWSAARRAIARLRRQGRLKVVGKAGRATLYLLADGGE
jgi:hypothetical protein